MGERGPKFQNPIMRTRRGVFESFEFSQARKVQHKFWGEPEESIKKSGGEEKEKN